MTHRYIKIGATSVVLIAAFVGLLWTTLREGTEYYKNVDEVIPNRQVWEGKPVQLHGYVVPGSRMRKPDTLDWKFKVQNNPARSGQSGQIVDAYYKGIVPDTFNDEAEVVLKGRLTAAGFETEPNGVIAKCPSKYEAASKSAGSSGL